MEEIIRDENDNVVYRKDKDGYWERNTYDTNGKLIRSEQHYTNGVVETEQYAHSDI